MIGAEMFGRPIGYDTANDAVVRVKATEVRKKLAQFYRETAVPPPLRIDLPSGSYVPQFNWSPAAQEPIKARSPAAGEPVPSRRRVCSGRRSASKYVISSRTSSACGMDPIVTLALAAAKE